MRLSAIAHSFSFIIFSGVFLATALTAQISPNESTDSGLGGGNVISGMVLSPAGGRMERRVTVRLITMTRGDRVTVTDEKGNFSFRGLTSGDYSVIIDKEKEFEPATQQVSILQMRGWPPQNYPLNIRLKLKAGSISKPGVVNSDLADVSKAALEFFNKGLEFANAGDHKAAIEQFRLAVTEYPDFMLAFNAMGVQYLKLRDLAKADESLQAAIKIKPDAFEPLVNRGIVLFSANRFSDAEPIFRKVLTIREDSPVGHYFLGQTVANLGRFDEAEKELISAVTLGGDEMKEAHRLLAIIYHAKGDKTRQTAELETYLRIAPNAPDAEQLRQVLLRLKGLTPPTTNSSTTKPSN